MKKKLLLFTMMFAANSAFASFYQVNCSNAERTISMEYGHVENKQTYTVSTRNSDGTIERKEVAITSEEHQVANLDDPQLLSKEAKNSCREGDMDGVAESTEITYQVMHITLKSGEAFPQGTMNLSKDGKTIVAHLICKNYFNSMVLCN